MDGRIRAFAAGQRSEIGRYKFPWVVALPGFGIGLINDDFHIDGICHVLTDRLKRAVMLENNEFVRFKCLTVSIALDCSLY